MNSILIKFAVPVVIVLILVAGLFVLKGTKKNAVPVVSPVAEQAQEIKATGNVDDAARALNLNADNEVKATLDESQDQDLITSENADDVTGAVNENDY